jgi:hypothetical protein
MGALARGWARAAIAIAIAAVGCGGSDAAPVATSSGAGVATTSGSGGAATSTSSTTVAGGAGGATTSAPRDAGADADAPDASAPPEPPPGLVTLQHGRFFAGATPLRPIGVNYVYPYFSQPYFSHPDRDWVTEWDAAASTEVEADFARMEQAGVREIRLATAQAHVAHAWDPAAYPTPATSYCARLGELLDRAGAHGIYVTLLLPLDRSEGGGNYAVAADPARADGLFAYAARVIDACGLASRPEILAWAIDLEGEVESPGDPKMRTRGRPDAVGLWNAWLADRYGSTAKAEARLGEALPRECVDVEVDANGAAVTTGCPDLEAWDAGCKKHGPRVCPPRLIESGGDVRWGPDTNAKRAFVRFTDWVMNRRTMRVRERLRQHDPWHLLTTDSILQDGYCSTAIFLRREQTMFTDFAGVHVYPHQYTGGTWDAATFGQGATFAKLRGTAAAIAWMDPERRPVIIGEVGVSVLPCTGKGFCIEGDEAAREGVQAALVGFEAPIFAAGGALAQRWWWWRGARPMGTWPDPAKPRDHEVSDFGVLRPTGDPRPALAAFAKTSAVYDAFEAVGPAGDVEHVFDPSPSCTGFFLDDASRLEAIAAVQDGKPFRARTICSGKDTTNAPATGLDGATYFKGCAPGDAEHCTPTVCLDAIFERVEVRAKDGSFVDARDGATIVVAKGAPVEVRVVLGNSGESRWNAGAAGDGRAKLALSGTGLATNRVALPASLGSFESTAPITFTAIDAIAAPTTFRLRMVAEKRLFFGESVTVSLAVD